MKVTSVDNGVIKPKRNKIKKDTLFALFWVSLPLVAYVFFNIFPLIISFAIQFFDMEYYDLSTLEWNNYANFSDVFNDPNFWLSLGVSFFLTMAHMISLCICLFIAVLLNKKPKGHKIFQTLFFVPYICSSVAVSIMWRWMFDVDHGVINSVLVSLFGADAKISWFIDPKFYPWMLFIAIVWQAPGYGIVMYKAALGALNKELFEAADVDGANSWKKFSRITLPAIAPTTFFLLLSGIIAGMQTFDIAKIFAGDSWTGISGPDNVGLTTVLYIYNTGTKYNNMPKAAVMSWVLFVIVFLATMINFKLRKKWVDEQ